MIARVKGIVWESEPLKLVIDVGGVGYAVNVPLSERLPSVGEPVELFTHAIYREDSATLYGFQKESQRNFFVLLIEKVSGIGPKTAMGLLTHMSVERLTAAIESGDVDALKAAPGIGRKTAERLLLELKGLSVLSGANNLSAAGPQADAINALVSLGYTLADAQRTIQKIVASSPQASTNDLIRLALKKD
jgi:Holliday junction DNA helicase RuvA